MKKIYFSGNKNNNIFVLVDNDDYIKLNRYKWYLSKHGYAVRNNWDGKINHTQKMHKDILSHKTGFVIDHKDGNKLNNTKDNLRIATYSQNGANCRISKRNKSGYKGVWARNNPYKTKKDMMWKASIMFNKKVIGLGCFKTKKEAAIAYNKKALELFGDFAKLNIIK